MYKPRPSRKSSFPRTPFTMRTTEPPEQQLQDASRRPLKAEEILLPHTRKHQAKLAVICLRRHCLPCVFEIVVCSFVGINLYLMHANSSSHPHPTQGAFAIGNRIKHFVHLLNRNRTLLIQYFRGKHSRVPNYQPHKKVCHVMPSLLTSLTYPPLEPQGISLKHVNAIQCPFPA